MKITFWLTVGVMVSLGTVAQELTNVPPAGDLQNTSAPATTQSPAVTVSDLPATGTVPASASAPAKPQKKPTSRRMAVPPDLRTVPLKPGMATVVASNVNVRGQAGLKGEVVTRLTKGDQVTVLEEIQLAHSAPDEPSAWAKILLPPAAKVFVFADYINQAGSTVSARRLNLRAGPGENYSVLGRLERGDAVKVVATRGNWLEIEPPAKAYAFMAAQYLHQEEAPAMVVETAKPAETKTDGGAVPPPVTTSTVTESPAVAAAASEVPGGANTGTTNIASAAPATSSSVSTPPQEDDGPLPPRIVQREGLVRGTLSIQAPTRFELWDPVSHRTINYLHTEGALLDLSRYKGLHIIVTGEESLDERWRNTPILDIQKIVVLE